MEIVSTHGGHVGQEVVLGPVQEMLLIPLLGRAEEPKVGGYHLDRFAVAS
jgi:hypothetical protein